MSLSLSNNACYSALSSRDPRFDGQFFVGVSSTGIYCRPICRVRLPAQKNCHFYESAAMAESQGYRPCLRCRPELTTRWCTESISETLADKAVALINENFTNPHAIQTVSDRLGVSERHLRRMFSEHLGVSPLQLIQTRRLLLAKQLLSDTDLKINDVSINAGFGSVRRLNHLLKVNYGLTPTQLRKSQKRTVAMHATSDSLNGVSCQLNVVSPYDFHHLLAFHKQRAVLGLETVEDGVYTRSLEIYSETSQSNVSGWYRVQAINDVQLVLHVSPSLSLEFAKVISIVRAQFDLDSNPHHWLPTLGALAAENPGLRLPGCVDGFELAVRAILGQQISVAAATTLVSRLVDLLGGYESAGGPGRTFPSPSTVANCDATKLGKLGIIRSRVRAIQCVAAAVEAGEIQLNSGADIQSTRDTLKNIPGIGDWTINYLLMRAIRWPDAFVDTDLGIKKAAAHLGILDVREAAKQWKPWRAYAAMHLWQSLGNEVE